MSFEILSVWILVAACALAQVYTLHQLQQTRRQIRRLNAHRIADNSSMQKERMDLLELRNRAKVLEDTVSGGTSAVEKAHKAISSTTFGLISLFAPDDSLRQGARKARRSHDAASDQVYKAIHTTNRALHILADTLFIDKAEKKIVSRRSRKPSGPGTSR